ncbi:MAG: aminoglycoside phosphotransferase family protein [Acidobacteriia bacterium]|nr:aminoglycoside phosphotransferase family protein [Terriglobia bacterium]
MESTQHSDRETYRAIVFGQGGDQLLLAPATGGFLLPSVEIPRWQRIAETLTAAMRREWGHEVVCLFNPDVSVPIFSASHHNYQVMESRGPGAESSPRAGWVRVASLSEEVFLDPADYIAVRRSLADCAGYSDGAARGPFAKLGWFEELQVWIEEVIRPLSIHLTGSFSQLNASPSFSLVRFETNNRAIWFKAVGKPNLREFPITLALARLLPQYLPPILAARPEWNGWLCLEVNGVNLCETQDVRHWKAAISALAKLQIESIGSSGELFQCRARDLRAGALSKLVRPFFDVMADLMEKQTKVSPPVLSKSELILLREQIEEALSLSADLGIPDALGHLDLNPGNVIVAEGQCVFLDWAEAYVGNPLFSFQYLVEHFRRVTGVEPTSELGLTTTYAEEWQSLVSPESLQEALALTPMLAVFAYTVATDAWSDQAKVQDPKVAGYLRSLTRRVHRETTLLKDRSALCPN